MLCLVNGEARVSGFPSISPAANLAEVWTDTMVAVQQWVLNWTLQLGDSYSKQGQTHDMHGRTVGTHILYQSPQRHSQVRWILSHPM